MSGEKPDTKAALHVLKDFQRDTVEYVFDRLYRDQDYTRRFLIADEAGLGKTLVARGIIAKAVNHLWERKDRIDVVYVCSNTDIARQNINRLNFTAQTEFQFASRITLLPIKLHHLKQNRLNFVSFTPGTSFRLHSNIGRAKERVLLYWLLKETWDLKGAAPKNVLQGRKNKDGFRRMIRSFHDEHTLDDSLVEAFWRGLERQVAEEQEKDVPTLQQRFDELCQEMSYARQPGNYPERVRRKRRHLVGDLRNLLADTCISALEPDLVILDEFQRFKQLLSKESGSGELAHKLFAYSDEHSDTRVLLLSATPYKMYTLEREEENHYRDFLHTIRFLEGEDHQDQPFEDLIDAYRSGLYDLGTGEGGKKIFRIKDQIEGRLQKYMVRTERLAETSSSKGMLKPSDLRCTLEPQDIETYLGFQRIADTVEHWDVMNYWKSAPYLLNFMNDGYELKKRFAQTLDDPERGRELAKTLQDNSDLLLSWEAVKRYGQLNPPNTRLRVLTEKMVDSGLWKLLWMPPSLPYYALEEPFSDVDSRHTTKHLIFSAWRVIPKAIACLVSYEAERRMMQSFEGAPENTTEARESRSRLLEFAVSNDRLTGMPVLGLVYPSFTLAQLGDPLALWVHEGQSEVPTLREVRQVVQDRLRDRLQALPAYASAKGDRDEAWYWAAPILLDRHSGSTAARQWFEQSNLAERWYGVDEEDSGKGWELHVERARRLFQEEIALGTPPENLARVLADMALAAPSVAALRALSRMTDGSRRLSSLEMRKRAAQIGWGFLTLFNRPEVTALIRGMDAREPYWHRVLEYAGAGGIQAVLDEYVHVLRESLGLVGADDEEAFSQTAHEIYESLTIRTVSLRVDEIQEAAPLDKQPPDVGIRRRRMRAHYALRFGDEQTEGGTETTRSGQVRQAFNSPFWPFVLATTSVGKEGLDFHTYCHAVMHWNLPYNPIDLEQREGRVHRYKGYAVRKNIARKYKARIPLEGGFGSESDPWKRLFTLAVEERESDRSDLYPFWVCPDDEGAKIERCVPALPFSREEAHLKHLRRSLAAYRMVFGQSRQEDLVAYLNQHLGREEIEEYSTSLRVNLSPFFRWE